MKAHLTSLWMSKSTLHGTIFVQDNAETWFSTVGFHKPLAALPYNDLKQIVDAIERYWEDAGEDGHLF